VRCFVHSLRFLHSSLLSVPNRKALPDMLRAFQFVDHRNGVILNRNIAMAGGVYQKLVASEAEFPRALSSASSLLKGRDRTIQVLVRSGRRAEKPDDTAPKS
jgi:hypothetical protein